MDMKNFLAAMEHIETDVAQVIGAIKATIYKQKTSPTQSKQVSAVLMEGEEMRKYKGKTIKKRADGRYWTRYYKYGKQCSVYGQTINECLQNLKQALSAKKQLNAPSKQTTLDEWLKKWLELYKVGKLKESTLEQMKRYLNDVSKELGQTPLNKLTSISLQEFLNNVPKERKREKLYLFLKDALTKAMKNKLISDNPFDAIDKPRHAKKESRSLTHDEEIRFIEACQKNNQGNLFLLCLYQGLRLGEALALTYEDVDFKKNVITINKSIDSLENTTTPKTTASIRTIPLFNRSLTLLDKNGKGKIFRYKRKVYQNTMAQICKHLGLQGINIHALRHTFATRCSEAGVAAKTVQKWLGHSTIEMTLNVYTHINEDFESKETTKIDTYFDTYSI